MRKLGLLLLVSSSTALGLVVACGDDDSGVVVASDAGPPPPLPAPVPPPPPPPPPPVDAGADADAGFCAAHTSAFYCEDFGASADGGAAPFGTIQLAGGASDVSVQIADAERRLATHTDGAQAAQTASLVHDFGTTLGAPTDLAVEADVRCSSGSTSFATAGLTVRFDAAAGPAAHQIAMLVANDLLAVNEGEVPADGGPFVAYPESADAYVCDGSTFRRWKISIHTGSSPSAALFVDGILKAQVALTAGFQILPRASIRLGVTDNETGTPVDLRFDDVLVTKN